MWPSFSLWACRILKIKSCLRSPLAPGKSNDRAILVSSVIFFSLSSAMVIIHLRKSIGGALGKTCTTRGSVGGTALSSPPLCLNKMFRLGKNRLPFRTRNPVQNLVHGFLNPGVGFVEPARRLRSELAEHVT